MNIDLKKRHRRLYAPPADDVVEVTVPPMTYLAASGHGDPNATDAYQEAVESLYAVAYAVRAAHKARTGDTFTVGPLEGLWSSEDPADFVARIKKNWDWTMLIPLPDEVSAEDVEQGRAAAAAAKPALPIESVGRMVLDEGRCVQILHVGPYDDEGPALADLHGRVMPDRGLTWNGRHHEIYLGDPRRTAPAKLRTVLRQPVTDVV